MGPVPTPICCSKHETFSADEKKRWGRLKDELAQAKAETRELADGFAFRLEGEKARLVDLAEWVWFESRCCPFFHFEIDLLRNQGPLWLKIRGAEGAKEFVFNLTIMKSPGRTAAERMVLPSPPPAASPVCCNSGAFSGAQKARYKELNSKINGARIETRHFPDGYAHRLRNEKVSLPELAEWVLLERVCCPFLDFGIEVEQEGRALWVSLTGIPEGGVT